MKPRRAPPISTVRAGIDLSVAYAGPTRSTSWPTALEGRRAQLRAMPTRHPSARPQVTRLAMPIAPPCSTEDHRAVAGALLIARTRPGLRAGPLLERGVLALLLELRVSAPEATA